MDVSYEMNVIYSYLTGLARTLDDLQAEMGPSFGENKQRRLDCADKLFFMTRSVECFADRVSKLWETADLEGYAQRRGGREAS